MTRTVVAHTNSYHTYPFEVALDGIAEAGYRWVELSAVADWTPHVSLEDDPREVATRLGDRGLQAIAIAGHSDLTTDSGMQTAIEGVEWAADYGLGLFTTAIGGHASQREDLDAFLVRIGALAAVAERLEVTVALEIHGEIMATGQASMPLIDRIGSEAIRVKYDTGNCEFYGGVRAVDDIHHVGSCLVNIDAKDKLGGVGEWDFPPPGDGHIDWKRLLAVLDDLQYDGPLTVEVEFTGEPWPPVQEVTRAMRRAREFLVGLST